jgi:NitT/TauT family transport system substrate-binding protein/sulfonate transport system substrate-binding protein
MRFDSIDIGAVGDTPPIFAQVARANLLCVAAAPSGVSAILLPPGSASQALQDLEGRRVAFARGSAAHNPTIAALELEKSGITYADIEPVYLAPADAAAAFERGSIDAWTIWDPFCAIYEKRPGVRVLATSTEIAAQNSFFMARQSFVQANPDIVNLTIAEFGRVGAWAAANRQEVAKLVSDATGCPKTQCCARSSATR